MILCGLLETLAQHDVRVKEPRSFSEHVAKI